MATNTGNQRRLIGVVSAIGFVVAAVFARGFEQLVLETISDVARLNLDTNTYRSPFGIFGPVMLGLFGGAIAGSIAAVFVITSDKIARKWEQTPTGQKINLFLSVVIGILGTLPIMNLTFALASKDYPWLAPVVALLFIFCLTSLSLYALKNMGEALPWVGATQPRWTGIKVLDTNILIDGRIYDVARAGFLEGKIYVPKFVLEELQHIADSPDSLRRVRGRRGLDLLTLLQSERTVEVGTHDHHAADKTEEVDSRLVRLTKAIGGQLVTNDMNLNRVAGLQKVPVLSLNDLAMALKPNILPGEAMPLQLTREGSQPGQAVGYLDDGTMVVVEGGKDLIGEFASVHVVQVIQTERGKMIFAELPDQSGDFTTKGKRPRRG